MTRDRDRARARTLLEVGCLALVVSGLLLASNPWHGLLGFWERSLDRALGASLPLDARPFVATIESILGGTLVGEASAAWFVIRHGLRAGHRWAWEALWLGQRLWFGLSFVVCIVTGAQNTLLTILLPIFLTFTWALWRARPSEDSPAMAAMPDLQNTRLFCIAQVIFGSLLFVLLMTPVFTPYTALLWEALWPTGASSPLAESWLLLGFGLVGAFFAAHFTHFAVWALRAPQEGPFGRAYAVSLLA